MPAFDPTQPFALLADGDSALLFTEPRAIFAGTDLPSALPALRQADGWLAGCLSFESGLALEPRLAGLQGPAPFHWFGCFAAMQRLGQAGLSQFLAPFRERPASTGALTPLVERDDWLRAVRRAQTYIAAGDIYQVNLTFPMRVPMHGHPLSLFAHLFNTHAAPHGGILHDGAGRWWLSFSPELFFRLADGRIEVRPMKGTAPRANSWAADREMALALANDPKNRAENLMITDLLRNDLGRIAVPGSVHTSALFEVETYPSVHQMTSTVAAVPRPGQHAVDLLAALYPCGSITGAPKIRAIEILRELEPYQRGAYCGGLGWIGPGGNSAHFNVAIRTLSVAGGKATLGLGAGIVADSNAEDEWAECQLKGRFLQPSAPTSLIETMRLAADGSIPRLGLHLDRMEQSARRFGFAFDRPTTLHNLARLGAGPERRLRLLLGASGETALHLSALPALPPTPVQVAIVPQPLAADDWRLHHKSSTRAFHEQARRNSRCFECMYERPDGLLTEGSFTNLFVPRDGLLLTPPQQLGLLPGVLRAELLQQGRAREYPLTRADLQDGFLLGNSLRGLFPAQLAGIKGG